jgi:transcriptional antiterminator NusG
MDIFKMPYDKLQYYVIHVLTGKEKKYIDWARHTLHDDVRIVWPRRRLSIRKAGIVKEGVSSLYPGYLFLETRELADQSIAALRKAPGFVRFLRSDYDIIPLDNRDKELFLELISYGEIIPKSQVVLDENSRIRVIEGPLKQLEGAIVKVDQRKGRAKVQLHLQGKSLLVDLGFEVMETVPGEA